MTFGTAYMGTHTPEGLKRDLDDIRKLGFNEVVLSCQENDFMHFTGKVEYAPKIAHDAGIRVLVNLWGYANAFGGGRMSRLVSDYPEVRVVAPDGSPRWIDWGGRIQPGCPNHPLVIARAQEYCSQAIATGADGFFWDEPTKFDCYCEACRTLFTERTGGDLAIATPEVMAAFRRYSVFRWVDEMSKWVKSRDQKLVTSTCVMPSDRDAWEDAAKCEHLDSLGTDTYWMFDGKPIDWMREPCARLVKLAREAGKSPHLWLQCWKIEKGRESEIVQAAKVLAESQPDAIYVWGYRGQLGTTETCVDPERSWECAIEGLRSIGMKSLP